MIRSMTGFARRERQYRLGPARLGAQTVNHRFLEVGCRLPEELRAAEAELRQAIAAAVRRGKVECALHFRPRPRPRPRSRSTPIACLAALAAQQVAAQAGGAARIDVMDVLRWPGRGARARPRRRAAVAAAHALLAEALAELARFRDSEGGRLRDALEQRCAGLQDFAARVAARLPEVRARMRAKLIERIAQLAADVDQERLEQELAMLAQRLDVDEEIDRLRGHVAEIRKAFAAQRAGRPATGLPDAGTESRGQHAVVEVAGHRDDARGGRYEGADRADARTGAEHRMTSRGIRRPPEKLP